MSKYRVKVEGEVFELEIERIDGELKVREDAADHKEESPPQEVEEKTSVSVTGEELKAPLPGTIASIAVSEGDTVKEGELIFVLEAMKMENDISAPNSGRVKSINVSQGEKVEADTLLAVIG